MRTFDLAMIALSKFVDFLQNCNKEEGASEGGTVFA